MMNADMNPNSFEYIEANNPVSYELMEEKNYVPDIVNIAVANMAAMIFTNTRLRNTINRRAAEYTKAAI